VKLQIGNTVRTLVDKEPFYPGYGDNPTQKILAGTVGCIMADKIPSVRYQGHHPYYSVRFYLRAIEWRAPYYEDELKKIKWKGKKFEND
jgi:hypothetical protein